MARLFDDGSNEYLQIGSAVLTAVPLTMACWFRSDNISDAQALLTICDVSEVHGFYLYAAGHRPGDPVGAIVYPGPTAAETSSSFSANTWHHACGVFATATSRTAYIDGGSAVEDTTDVAPTGLDATAIGRECDTNPAAYMSGRIAEVGIWNVALTAAEVAILAEGYSPLFVHPQNLVAYWPLIRDEDQDRVGGYDMTAHNTPAIAVHPPVLYPAPHHIAYIGAAAAPGGQPTSLRAATVPGMRQWQPRIGP